MSDPLPLRSVPMQHLLHPTADPAAFRSARDILVDGLTDHGLVYLHFPPELLPHYRATVPPAFAQSRAFFGAAPADKATATAPAGALPAGVTRGYLPVAAESGGDAAESKETFAWSVDDLSSTPSNPFEHPNVWPPDPRHASLRTAYNALFDYVHDAMRAVVAALDPLVASHALEHVVRAGRSVSMARAFVYHGRGAAGPRATGSVAHTDWGLATILAQEAGSVGLEVEHGDAWRVVIGRADTLLFAVGDFLSLASRGLLHSPRHRVVLGDDRRFSFAFFQYPPYGTALPDRAGLDRVAGALSLFTDQRPGATGRLLSGKRADGSPLCFGEFVAQKWDHVSRA